MRASGIAVTLSICLLGACATTSSTPVWSWGKAGVSFQQYRTDSTQCAIDGADMDVAATEEYRKIDQGLTKQDHDLDTGAGDVFDKLREYHMTYERSLRGNVGKIQDQMVTRLEGCLIRRGYQPFELTAAQAKKLGGFQHGSEARFRYLHALGSDPANLSVPATKPSPAS